MPSRRVVFVAFEGMQALDLVGPAEVFSLASRLRGDEAYATRVVARMGDPVRSSSGLAVIPDGTLASAGGPLDTLVVVGGTGVSRALEDEDLLAWIARAAPGARRVCSVCTGAFLLAATGLLDGRRATTHWASCGELARRHPEVTVERDPIFVRDGAIATSAGVTAGMDLALALVEEDHGPRLALEVARSLVLFTRRPGGQSQFSAQLASLPADRGPLRELQAWIADHLGEDLTVPALAARAGMSERSFARAFRRETGVTPAVYVEELRVERARMALEGSTAPVEHVARACGFGTVETLRRAFHRRLGVGPAAYRARFRPFAA